MDEHSLKQTLGIVEGPTPHRYSGGKIGKGSLYAHASSRYSVDFAHTVEPIYNGHSISRSPLYKSHVSEVLKAHL